MASPLPEEQGDDEDRDYSSDRAAQRSALAEEAARRDGFSDGFRAGCQIDAVILCYQYAGAIGIKPHGLTLRELWVMYHGRQKMMRSMVLAQSNLVAIAFTGSASRQALMEFIDTGRLDADSATDPSVENLPYDADAWKQAVRDLKLGTIKG